MAVFLDHLGDRLCDIIRRFQRTVNRSADKRMSPFPGLFLSFLLLAPAVGWAVDAPDIPSLRCYKGRQRQDLQHLDCAQQIDGLGQEWEATLNGVLLQPDADVSPLYSPAYPDNGARPKPDALRAWTVPPGLLRDGENDLKLKLARRQGFFVKLRFWYFRKNNFLHKIKAHTD